MRRPINHDLDSPQKFKVTITETLERTVEVEADNQQQAKHIVSDKWYSCGYIFDADDFIGVEFAVVPDENNTE